MKKLILYFIVWLQALAAPASTHFDLKTVQALQKAGYLKSSIDHWLKSIEMIEKETNTTTARTKLLAESYLGLLQTCLALDDKNTFKKYEDAAMTAFEELGGHTASRSEALAWKGALYGWKIALSPMKAMFLGPKSQSLLEKALQSDKECPEAWVRRASSYLFSPETFGGDPNKAVQYFAKGVELYEKQKCFDWKYLDALAWLGQAYQKTGQPEKAREI